METIFFYFSVFIMVLCGFAGVSIIFFLIWAKKASKFIDIIESEHGNFKNDFPHGGDSVKL